MKFYNVKTKSFVEVPDSSVKKKKMPRKTKAGTTQIRYAFVAEHNGTKLYKFVSEADYKKLNAPEI
ncbi:MAG TPA: hypothetical protein VNK96_00620 [Fimbriimonadales bacterium]|nr:hypothetical protein [Fimbriimonadales bacterium]